jgi:hypothetical protein
MSQGPNPLEGDGLAEALPDQTQCASTSARSEMRYVRVRGQP